MINMQSLSSASFNSYSSSDKLTQIADRVVREFQSDDDFLLRDTSLENDAVFTNNNQQQEADDNESEGEFEFALAPVSPIPADELFYKGQIRPVYPLFNTELVFGNDVENNSVLSSTIPKAARLPLGKLFVEERERDNSSSSCSSSESDELDRVPAETYCVWAPKTADNNSREMCKKSSSTGTSKRWKFRDLLHKSNSDGKDTFDFLTLKTDDGLSDKEAKIAGKDTKPPLQHYLKKGPAKENHHHRRSYLPYKKDLVELFFNVNGVSRNVNPY